MDEGILNNLPKTPMWEQYSSVKRHALDALLLYRMGDFYELFLDDAVEASRVLGITLTARNKNEGQPIPMCGFPFHSATLQINKLLAAGLRVAICEQTEDPAATKGLVKREIVRIVSPGMAFDADSLESSRNNFMLALQLSPEAPAAFCALDISTGASWFGTAANPDELRDELALLQPREILAPQGLIASPLWQEWTAASGKEHFLCVTPAPDFHFRPENAFSLLCEQFGVLNLDAFGLPKEHLALGCVGAAYRRAKETQRTGDLRHLQVPRARQNTEFLQLDESTIDHLDLFPKPGQAPQDSLFFHLDQTATAMGARRLREILARPLANKAAILERQDALAALIEATLEVQRLREALSGMRDIERLIAKIGLRTANPRDLVALREIFARLPNLKASLRKLSAKAALLARMEKAINEFADLQVYLETRLLDEPPAITREGNIFRSGFSPELDELIALTEDGKSFLAKLETQERAATGIASLKVKYNRVFGYYIEVTSANLAAVPAHYVRRQTTAGGERFITEELKTFEDKILRAQDRRIALEESLFEAALVEIGAQSQAILASAQEIALLDALLSLARAAREYGYVRPEIVDDAKILDIEAGKHPALEHLVGRDRFIANDVSFNEKERLFLITGPNMAGKSTFMRQTALLVLLAQAGSYVPAKRARIGLTDRIATRVGANDRIGRGQSTFMVEMNEMARILRQATARSFLVIDEIGRGTSTYDGLALAWAIVEDIQQRLGARTLFATHYHELTKLESQLSGLKNLSVAVEERDGQILFLHKVRAGKAPGSYGVEVARLAGLPLTIVQQAREILDELEKTGAKRGTPQRKQQLSLFAAESPAPASVEKVPSHLLDLEKSLRALDLNQTSPLSALLALKGFQEKLPPAGSSLQ